MDWLKVLLILLIVLVGLLIALVALIISVLLYYLGQTPELGKLSTPTPLCPPQGCM